MAVRDLEIDFWDVGQGDCSVIYLTDGSLIIIDVGGRGSPLIDWLSERRNHPVIRAIILTHNDSDHAGALPTILKNHIRDIETVWMLRDRPKGKEPFAKIFRLLKEAQARNEISVRRLEDGAEIWQDLVTNLKLRVAYPTFVANESAKNPNETSGLILLEHSGKILCSWPGDLPVHIVAERLGSQKPELLHGPHHGGPTDFKKGPGRKRLREAVPIISPKMAYISVGTQNSYNHPRPGYLRLLASLHCRCVCSQITNACDRQSVKNRVPVFEGSGVLGLRAARTGISCRGSWRIKIVEGGIIPDEFTDLHLNAVSKLRRPQCLKGTGWKTGDDFPWENLSSCVT